MNKESDLIIIGAGAAGLMAGSYAADFNMSAVILERKHRAGSKLLMCGNGRCNLTTDLSTDRLLQVYGEDLIDFLSPAIKRFDAKKLQNWFRNNKLPLLRTNDGKIFPSTERASDVVHCFTDKLRENTISLCLNAPVQSIKANSGFEVYTTNFALKAKNILIATGGVSYPKTGSVGDGQRIAKQLGHTITPFRPGLVGIIWNDNWLANNIGHKFTGCNVKISTGKKFVAESSGVIECERWGLGGGAILNATRIISRKSLKYPELKIEIPEQKKTIIIKNAETRPLKEAMVTIGGIKLNEINNHTMESLIVPGIYFAGEILDIDGPTGGFNLTAAFATARLAIDSIAQKSGKQKKKNTPKKHKRTANHRYTGKNTRDQRSKVGSRRSK